MNRLHDMLCWLQELLSNADGPVESLVCDGRLTRGFPAHVWMTASCMSAAFAHRSARSGRCNQTFCRFIELYLRHCCLKCRQRRWIYNNRGSGGLHGGGSNRGPMNRGRPPSGSLVLCPECQAKHEIKYDDWRIVVEICED